MNKKQYNIIEHSLQYDCKVTDSSLDTARTVFNNMGVALPQGTMKEVYDTISANEYMGWRKCTLEETKDAANNGTAAIGISEDKIVILSAEDEEQPTHQTSSVLTLTDSTPAMVVDSLTFYQYANMRTGGDQYGATWSSLDAAMNYYGTDYTYTYCGGYYNYYYTFSDGSKMYFRVA